MRQIICRHSGRACRNYGRQSCPVGIENDTDNKDMNYECIECGATEIVKANDHRKDGRVCSQCKGHMSAKGFIFGIDLAKGKDRTGYIPPIK